MLYQASTSRKMGPDMKESGGMTTSMDKVRKMIFDELYLSVLILFNVILGKYIWNDGTRYEGKYKADKRNGLGKKSDLY